MQTEYEAFVAHTWGKSTKSLRELFIMNSGLAGETGEVCELLKKDVRGRKGQGLDRAKLLLELGDVQNYLTRIAQRHGLSLDLVQRANMAKLRRRTLVGKSVRHETAMASGMLVREAGA